MCSNTCLKWETAVVTDTECLQRRRHLYTHKYVGLEPRFPGYFTQLSLLGA